ncbi:ferrochelatase [Orientia chuto str. Dubai]|uniref:Ferrochelatase n=1 Tax=Orientia chuto str. Dubai TaxID=1359168 RepID=A0A0F3MKD7_9RICK|nr:ferrochelatase [Orientia chuto str. Dubai]
MSKKNKTAIVLLNLGGPDKISEVKQFLFNLFYDKYIIQLSNPWRFLLAKAISLIRNKSSQKLYEKIGGKSPILPQTILQSEALRATLKNKLLHPYEVFVAMRHWSPMINEVVLQIKEYQPEKVILLPLYPQFSISTTLSAIEEFKNSLLRNNFDLLVKTVCCYPVNTALVDGYSNIIKSYTNNFSNSILLFSAHGLPKKFITQGDPYQWQIEISVQSIVKKLNVEGLNWKISYQSKIGPLEWLKPDTKSEIIYAAKNKKNIIIVPISFVSEHVETLVELDIEYSDIAKNYGVSYCRIKTLGVDSFFIDGLADLTLKAIDSNNDVISGSCGRICPQKFIQCIHKN